MLPDRFLQLLTAFVDGEASARERKLVERLLRKSPKARTVLGLLQEDSRGVRDLTRLKLGPDFPAKVMRTVGRSEILPSRPRRAAPAPSTWVGMAVAASVLVAISAGSYWYFAPRQHARVEGPTLVHRQADPIAGKAVEGVFGRFGQSAIRLAAGELATETTRKSLAGKLRQESAYNVDLAVQDNGRAVERLAAALQLSGVKVLMAAGTQNSLKQKQGKIRYLLFAENLKPEELASILHQLGSHSSTEAKGNRQEAGLRQVVVDVMTREHRQQLTDLLAIPKRKGPSDPPMDLVNKTLIAKDSAGQGTQPAAPKTAPQPVERFALVLAFPQGSLTSPADSPELRTFMRNRREQRPGTLQVLLVVHEASV